MSARDPLAERYNLLGHDAPPVEAFDKASQAVRVLGFFAVGTMAVAAIALLRAGAL